MVLRDNRDKLTSKRILCRRKTRADAKWARRKSKTQRRKSRTKTKKNIDRPVVFTRKEETVIQEEKVEKNKDVCSICCESTKNIKYINCKRGGVQSINFGKYGECCKDKSICDGCRSKCSKCPFCMEHSLIPLKNRFPQKKPTFAVRQERIMLKMRLKKIRERFRVEDELRATIQRRVNRFFGNEPHPYATRWEMRQSRWADAPMEIISYFD